MGQNTFLVYFGFVQFKSDISLYIMRFGSTTICVLLHFDDMFPVSPDKNELKKVAASLTKDVDLRVKKMSQSFWAYLFLTIAKRSLQKVLAHS